MKIQDYIADEARKAAEEAFKYARAVPEDKLDWSPGEGARSVLSMCRELAMTPTWAYDTIQGDKAPEFNEETFAAIKREQEQWKTVEDCQKEFNNRYEKLEGLYRSLSDQRLSDKKWLPYDGGRDFTVLEMMDYPRWNATYHLGQVCYVQLMLGDKEMH